MRHSRKFLLAAPLVAAVFAIGPLSQTARATEPAGAMQATSSATPIGDVIAKIRCLALLYIGNTSVDAMNQANQDGEAAIETADAEAYKRCVQRLRLSARNLHASEEQLRRKRLRCDHGQLPAGARPHLLIPAPSRAPEPSSVRDTRVS